jgi:hypothetical protein
MADGDVPRRELYRRLFAINAIFETKIPLTTCLDEAWDRQPAHEGD